MADRVLTDAELQGIANRTAPLMEALRAVEAAVLRKQGGVMQGLVAVTASSSRIGYVTEREARKRERVAWDRCVDTEFRAQWMTNGAMRFHNTTARDHIYPPLPIKTITRPRTVVLSYGHTISASTARDDNGWRVTNAKGQRCFTTDDAAPFGWAKTPADARALADLVENPMETVEVEDA